MKKTLYTTLLAMALVISTGTVNAQMSGQQMMGQNQQQSHHPAQKDQQQVQPGTTTGGMMGPGMMGQGIKGYSGGMGMMGSGGMGMMGQGMMGNRGMGMMGPGMMGSGGMGMMGSGMMMGSPMMGFAAGMNNEKISQYKNFIKKTRKMRKKLYDMRFEYGEALWNSKTTLKNLQEKLTKMNQLQQEIQQKIPR